MQVHSCRIGNGIKEFPYQLGIEVSHHGSRNLRIHLKIRSAAQIYRTQTECIVHRQNTGTEAFDGFLISKSFFDGSSKNNSRIFNSMVSIYMKISCNLYVKVEKSMTGKSL